MLNMKKGCKIKSADKLYEQYKITDYGYRANINVEKIKDFVKEFIFLQKGAVFFFLELTAKLCDEIEVEPGVLEATHTDVYYMDALSKEDAFNFLDAVDELLVNDGLACFGFGSQDSDDEISVGKYNVIDIFSRQGGFYDEMFRKFGIPGTESLVTAWDTFTNDAPGVSERIEINGKDVYSIPEEFKDKGLYFFEQRIKN